MSIFDIFRRKKSSEVAKERLMMVLSYERKGLPPNFADILQEDLIQVFSKYPQFDSKRIEVDLKNDGEVDQLWISIPFAKDRRE
ncbi:cell division topological specificity factor [Persephonella hydrogeniphila]|uniref:Cell division topological specificity factor n=1 Tax=Persephonella hydrogeniphila TaxID=198703 RepID=A0A285NHR4_9AQUI|nr:cell division topological specificity factor MinE [Persephonella hydrogeniphila]SNZ08453.1 cell division topological specificity factor [Persephonella hydrogeniphila]